MKCDKCGREFSELQCPFCGSADSPPDDIINLPVLRAETADKRKKKKMLKVIIIAAVVLLIVIAAVIAVKLGGRKVKNDTPDIQQEAAGDEIQQTEEPDTSPVTFSEDVSLSFEGFSLDYADAISDYVSNAANTSAVKESVSSVLSSAPTGTTKKAQITPEQHLETTTVKTETPTEPADAALKVINAFFTGTYYIDGDMLNGTEKLPLEMAMNGSDYQIFTEMEGIDICIMNLGGKLYLMAPNDKKYTEVNAALKKMMGINDDMFNFEFTKVKFDAYSPSSVTDAGYKGKKAVCYTYKDDSTKLDFIAVDNEIKQLTMYTSNGTAETVIIADEFTDKIPSEMFNFKGYSKTNIISFMTSFM